MQLANWRLINELLGTVDVALELVDIRDPLSTRSLRFERLAERKGVPVIIIMNKADLVPRRVAEAWKKYFQREGVRAVYISARERLGTRILRKAIKDVIHYTPLTAGIFGVPKVGKSSLINVLKGRHSASTSPYPGHPGYTRKAQLFRIGGDIYLIDTPGLIPPEAVGIEAEIRSVPVDELKNPVATAIKLIKRIAAENPMAFLEAYGIDSTEPDRVLRELALKRGWIYRKDKEPILQESAKAVIRDYLDGRIPFYVMPPRS